MMKKPSLLLVLTAFLAFWGLPLPSAFAQMDPSIQMVLGNPDGAVNSASSPTKYLIQRAEYALSFNDSLHFPNWVAWHLSSDDLGSAPRGDFMPDPNLPAGFTVIKPSDYTNTGYDRGHNCPSADRTITKLNNDQVFFMTNITPQFNAMNAGPWAGLETFCRNLVGGSRELLIYCGHGFTSSTHSVIGPQSIAVPDFGWKIVVVVPKSTGASTTDLLSRVTMRTRVIAVRIPNNTSVSGMNWQRYITNVSSIEAATGLVFFDKLDARTASVLKAKIDSGN